MTIKSFEEKCRRLYDTRLSEYVEKADQQLSKYEEQLLEAGSLLATERSRFHSRHRRLKLACARWKLDYQKDVHSRYQNMSAALEGRYMR
jgi:malate synthase